MTGEAKKALNALIVTAGASLYLFGVLWLCIYVSWWFAVVWFVLACWLAVLIAMTYRELKKQRQPDDKKSLTKTVFKDE